MKLWKESSDVIIASNSCISYFGYYTICYLIFIIAVVKLELWFDAFVIASICSLVPLP